MVLKSLTLWIITNCRKFLEMGTSNHLTCFQGNLYAGQESTVRTGHGTMGWFQIGNQFGKAVYCHLAYLTYMKSITCELLGWMKHKLESRLLREILITSDITLQTTQCLQQKAKRN